MSTVVESILVTLNAMLTTACTGVHVERSRVVALEREDLPALIIKPKDESAELLANGVLMCDLDIELEIHTRGDIPDQLADQIMVQAHQSLMADPSLGGQCMRLHYQGRAWEFSDSDRTAGKLTASYRLTYLTTARDLARQL